MSDTHPVQASTLRVGHYVMIDGRACKIISINISKTGKHGHAKSNIVGIDIFDGTKHVLLTPTTHNVEVPTVTKTEYQLIMIDEEGYLSLLNDVGEPREDIQLPKNEELAKQIQDAYDNGKELMVTIQSAIGREQVISFKESK